MRSDLTWFQRVMGSLIGYKISILGMIVVIVVLSVQIVRLSDKTVDVVVIDKTSGQALTSERELGADVLQNMVYFQTREFIAALHSNSSLSVRNDRKQAVWLMAPNVRKDRGFEVLKEDQIQKIESSGLVSEINYIIPPQITEFKYPNAKVYANFERIARSGSDIVDRVSFHVLVSWRFTQSTKDRPTGLFVTDIGYISDGDKTRLSEILNNIGASK